MIAICLNQDGYMWICLWKLDYFIMDSSQNGSLSNSTLISSPPRKHYNPIGSESQWSLGWQGTESQITRTTSAKSFTSYHNQSSVIFGDNKVDWKKESVQENDFRKKRRDPIEERPVWNYNPKNAGKTTMILGSDKPDYRKKGEVYSQRTPTTLTSSRRK